MLLRSFSAEHEVGAPSVRQKMAIIAEKAAAVQFRFMLMQACVVQTLDAASKVYLLHQKRSIMDSSESESTNIGKFSSG